MTRTRLKPSLFLGCSLRAGVEGQPRPEPFISRPVPLTESTAENSSMRWVKHYGSIALVVLVTMYAVKRIKFLNDFIG